MADILTAPADGSTITQPYLFEWQYDADALAHQIQIATDAAFENVVFESSSRTRDYVVSGLTPSTLHYWRVRTYSMFTFEWEDYSEVWSFTTAASGVTLTAPADTTTQTQPITFSWEAVSGAVAYQLQIATDEAFTTIVHDDDTLTTTSKEVPGLAAATLHYWRVRAGI